VAAPRPGEDRCDGRAADRGLQGDPVRSIGPPAPRIQARQIAVARSRLADWLARRGPGRPRH